MKNNQSYLIKLSIVLIIIGVSLFTLGSIMNGGFTSLSFGKDGLQTLKQESLKLQPFNELVIESGRGDIEIIEGNDYHLEYQSGSKLKIEEQTGKLSLINTSKSMSIGVQFEKEYIKITVPKEQINDIKIKTGLGNVVMNDIQVDTLKIETGGGDVELNNMLFNTIDLTSNLGNISLDNHDLKGKDIPKIESIVIKQPSGDTRINIAEANELLYTGNLGNLSITAEQIEKLDTTVKTGDLSLNLKSMGLYTTVTSGLGAVDINTKDDDFILDAETDLGDITVNGKEYHPDFDHKYNKKLVVKSNTGSIDVNTEKGE